MAHFFTEVQKLQEAGKLHKGLTLRLWIMFAISFFLLCAVGYNVIFHGANVWISLVLAILGFGAGMFLFSRMSPVTWNEKERVLEAARLDTAGFVILVLYIVFELVFRTLITDFFPIEATSFVLAVAFGTLLGRAIGTVIEIHRVYLASQDSKS